MKKETKTYSAMSIIKALQRKLEHREGKIHDLEEQLRELNSELYKVKEFRDLFCRLLELVKD